MSIVVNGDGPRNTHLMIVGERPGFEEARTLRPFVGPAGDELWDTLANHAIERERWYVTNLVKTFSKDPPTPIEIRHWAHVLRDELRTIKPLLVVTVGAHAARFFLGSDFDMRAGHGLLHTTRRAYTKTGNPSYVIPCFHSSAALRQPEMYQRPFRADIAQVARFFSEGLDHHVCRHPGFPLVDFRRPAHWDRAGIVVATAEGEIVGCDTEGTIERPEAITLYVDGRGFLCGVDRRGITIARAVLGAARRVVLHYAVHDLQVLWRLGIDVGDRVDDTMLQAYLLNEFAQGLKALCHRELRWQMDDYLDLVQPIDDARVRQTLEAFNVTCTRAKSICAAARKTKLQRDRTGDADRRLARAGTSVNKILTKPAEDTLRKRWTSSKFYDLCPLPDEPTWQDIPEEIGVPYAITDAAGAHDLFRRQRRTLAAERLAACYRMDRAVLPMLARIEQVGLLVDRVALSTLRDKVVAEYQSVCDRIEAILGKPLNPKASEDVSDVLFGELGVTPTQLTKGGKFYTTRDKYLEARKKEHEVIPLIIRGRELDKMRGSYCDRLPKLLTASGVYHPEWSYTRTATGRLAERIIILIPKHSDIGKLIRQCFVARPGNRILANDLAQIELRVLAHLSGDKALTQIFRDGRDPHTETAHDLLGAPARKEDQDESLHRLPSKKCNFGAFMGLSARGLTEQIRAGGNLSWAAGCAGCDDPRGDHRSDCDSVLFFREYFKKYSGIKSYIADRHAEARRTGYVRDLFGRRISCAGIFSTSQAVVRRTERIAQATPVQATADGISKHWMARIWTDIITPRRGLGQPYCEPWCRVHDDTLLECDKYMARQVQREVLAAVPQLLSIPTTADGKIGKTWGDLK